MISLVVAGALVVPAQNQPLQPLVLLDHLTGNWVLKGTIGGKQTTHDVQASWVLHHEYLQIHEISREKNADGQAAYEAIVLIGWDPKADQYTCLWLDSTSGAGLSNNVACKATPARDSIPFVFAIGPSESIHTTFTFGQATGAWRWIIDDIKDGKADRFADVELSREE